MNIFLSDTLWPPVIHVHLIMGGGVNCLIWAFKVHVNHNVHPQRVWFLNRFNQKLDIYLGHFGLKHGAILYNEAEVFSLSITNPNGQPMLPFNWLIQSGLILARCHKIRFFCFLRLRNKFEN